MAEAQKIVEHPPKPQGQNGEPMFDDRVKISNEKTGTILVYQPYALHVFGDDKTSLRERPIGSGNMFNEKGDPIGRWETSKTGSWTKVSDEHTATKPIPVNRVDALAEENDSLRAEIEALRAEKTAKETAVKSTTKKST